MAEYIIKTKSKKEEKVVKAFLSSLDIDFYTEAQQEKALYKKWKQTEKHLFLIIAKEKHLLGSSNLPNEI